MIWEKLTKRNSPENTVEPVKLCPRCGKEFSADQKFCSNDSSPLIAKNELGNEKKDGLCGKLFVERYNILSVLGEGGMSVVYKAHHPLMDRQVAIKLLKHFESSHDKMLKRFQQEARAASSLNHANLITLHDFGITSDGNAYIVMDYLEGSSLDRIIEDHGPINTERAVKIFLQVCVDWNMPTAKASSIATSSRAMLCFSIARQTKC